MSVDAGFIYGMDTDTPDKLWRRTDFIINSGVDVVRMTPLTPLPGTALFQRLQKENRLLYTNFPNDWERYDLQHVLFKPAHMTADQLEQILGQSKATVFSDAVIEQKYTRTLAATNDVTAYVAQSFNKTYQGALKAFLPEYFNAPAF